MKKNFPLSRFNRLFPDEDSCLQTLANLKYKNGISCKRCRRVTTHYRVRGRRAYQCRKCRNQTHPLKDTIFEHSSTPLRTWFLAIFLMTYASSTITTRQLSEELSVTYKTAWRMKAQINELLRQNRGNLMPGKEEKVFKWIFLNKLELKVVQKQG